jgi:hypothetical protein
MSANKAVTVLRSPSSASDEPLSGATSTLEADPCVDEVAIVAPAPFASGAPHLPQKSDVGGFSAIHLAQCFASALPHFAQKLFVERLFVPHFEQRIDAPPRSKRPTILYTQHRLRTSTLRKARSIDGSVEEFGGRLELSKKKVRVRPSPEQIRDWIDRLLRNEIREADLYGLDTPKKAEVAAAVLGQDVSEEEFNIRMARLTPAEQDLFMKLVAKLEGRWLEPVVIEEDDGSVETTATTAQSNGTGS